MRFRPLFSLTLVVVVILLSACQARTSTPILPEVATISPQPSTSTTLPTITATVTPTPPRSLVICLGQEPSSLYLYTSSTRATWGVLEALYDGPFDTRGFAVQPVILEKLPSLADGDARIQSVSVSASDPILDSSGNLSALVKGVRYLPSGCIDASCAVEWDGSSVVEMEQLQVDFKLKSGLKWSDGVSLTAADSVLSYKLSADPITPTIKRIANRTTAYEEVDDLTVRWTGIPGYLPLRFETFFWTPLPEHLYGKFNAQQMLDSEQVNKSPLGWGPYKIDEWVAGDHITLSKNPTYFRAEEGLPHFDTLVFRFPGEPADNNLAALKTGECDLVDQTGLSDVDYQTIFDLQAASKILLFVGQGPAWEHLDFGIKPASYDDYYYPGGDRPDFFSDLRVRQAIAYCTDRQGIVDELLYGFGVVPAVYIPPDHPLTLPDLKALPYDPTKGMQLLDEVGWKDEDDNPATPRTALSIQNIIGGTPFTITYLTSQAALRLEIAKRIAASLGECGIQVEVKSLPTDQLYAAGPDGPLFGRAFDLAEYAWDSSYQPPCGLYETSEIPILANNWLGGNVVSYSNPAYDTACQQAQLARSDQADRYIQGHQDAIRQLAEDIPSLPLFFHLKMAAARTDLCGFEMDVTARSLLWGIENLDMGVGCQK
jgi:peptide/nickel transport system substrate-binding protein